MYEEAVDIGLLLGEGVDGSGHVGEPRQFCVFFRSSGRRKTDVRNGGGSGVGDDDGSFALETWDVREQLSRARFDVGNVLLKQVLFRGFLSLLGDLRQETLGIGNPRVWRCDGDREGGRGDFCGTLCHVGGWDCCF